MWHREDKTATAALMKLMGTSNLKKTIASMGVGIGGKNREKTEKMKKEIQSEWKNIRIEIRRKMKCEKVVHTTSQGAKTRTP